MLSFDGLSFLNSMSLSESRCLIRRSELLVPNSSAIVLGLKTRLSKKTGLPSMKASKQPAKHTKRSQRSVSFENGAGSTQPGVPIYRYEKNYDHGPPAAAEPISWYLNGPSLLTPDMPAQPTAHQWQFDPAAGPEDFLVRTVMSCQFLYGISTGFDSGFHVSYRTNPFNEAQVLSGPGYLRAWVRSSVDEAHVQVTLSEIAPDDTQTLIQSGWLNIGHRRSSIDDKQRVQRTFSLEDYEDIPINEWSKSSSPFHHLLMRCARVPTYRSQSAHRVETMEHGAFEPPVYNGEPIFDIHIGGEKASQLTLSETAQHRYS